MKICEICGKDISERRGRARFCIECAKRRIEERKEAHRKIKVCVICGSPIDNIKSRKYCSICAEKIRTHHGIQKEKYCEICGGVIVGRSHNAKYCIECAELSKKACNNISRAKSLRKQIEQKQKEPQYGNQTKCKTCEFYDRYIKCCDYIGATGVARGCEPGPKCKKYERRMK